MEIDSRKIIYLAGVVLVAGMLVNLELILDFHYYDHYQRKEWRESRHIQVYTAGLNRTLACIQDCRNNSLEYFGYNGELYPESCFCFVNRSLIEDIWRDRDGTR